jgi:hypothetical protein
MVGQNTSTQHSGSPRRSNTLPEGNTRDHLWRNIGIALAVLAVLGLIAVVICLVPTINAAYTVSVPYEVTETKPLSYLVTRSEASANLSIEIGVYAQAFVAIENRDTVPGTFVVDFTFTTLNRSFRDSDRAYILPGESKTLRGVADISAGEDWNWSYDVTPATKTVVEERERLETRQEKVTLLKYWAD